MRLVMYILYRDYLTDIYKDREGYIGYVEKPRLTVLVVIRRTTFDEVQERALIHIDELIKNKELS